MKKILILAMALSIATVGLSANGGYGFKSYRGGGFYSALKSVNLTAEQKTQIREMKQAEREAKQADRAAKIAQMKEQAYASFSNNAFDRDLLVKNEITKATAKANSKADKIEKLLAILTDEQKKAFFTKIEEIKNSL